MQTDLLKNSIFEFLDEKECQTLLSCAKERSIQAGEILASENEPAENFFLLLSGSLQVSKKTQKGHQHVLREINPGEIADELSLIEDLPRSITLTAKADSALLVFDIFCIKSDVFLYNKVSLALNKQLSRRLRSLKSNTVELMQHRVEEYQKRIALGTFFVFIICVSDIYVLLINFIQELKKTITNTSYFSWPITFITILFVGYLIIKFKLPVENFGLNVRNWKKNLLESVIYSTFIIVAYTLFKWILISTVLKGTSSLLFDPKSTFVPVSTYNTNTYFSYLIIYILFVPIQEFLVRGVLQSSLYYFLGGPQEKRMWMSIIVANFLFGILHLHSSFHYVLLAFLPGIFWGWLFARQKSLLGVVVSHLLIGVWVVFISGLLREFL
jgi:membrane protease YdiL (CAAX protease family)